MKRLEFSTRINAPREKVWKVLWDDATYRQWTKPFSEGSYAESDWKEGSTVHFLDPNGDGMYSRIERKVENEYMSFKHIGAMKEKKELPLDKETEGWSGAMENYTLKESNGATDLSIDMDITDDHEQIFKDMFPKALAKVKELAEK